jgi:hypothetical protein
MKRVSSYPEKNGKVISYWNAYVSTYGGYDKSVHPKMNYFELSQPHCDGTEG